MGNRFHNKFHRKNHHTRNTVGDDDSSRDPIGSGGDYFQGDFYADGLLSVSGDIYLYGDLDMDGNSLENFSSTTEVSGVTRIATQYEVDEGIVDDAVVTPKTLKTLFDNNNDDANPPHELISVRGVEDDHGDSALSFGGISEQQTLTYGGGVWTNGELPTTTQFATDEESWRGVANDCAINPKQLFTELRRNKPMKYDGVRPSYNRPGYGILEYQTTMSKGTLAFVSRTSTGTAGKHGNGSYTKNITRHTIYRWSGSYWQQITT